MQHDTPSDRAENAPQPGSAARPGDPIGSMLTALRPVVRNVREVEHDAPWSRPCPAGQGGFYAVLSGHLTAHAKGRTYRVGPREAVFVPADGEHLLTISHSDGLSAARACRFLAGNLMLLWAGRAIDRALGPTVATAPGDVFAGALIDMLAAQLRSPEPGSDELASQLIGTLCSRGLQCLAETAEVTGGLLRAGLDPHIGPVLGLIEERPGLDWSLESLADEAGLSRSSFVERFTQLVGVAPGRYLRDARMLRADALLREQGATVAEAARAVGYRSESAFSAAFRRWAGEAPGARRRR